MFKKFVSILLCLIMLLSLTAVCAFADDTEPSDELPVDEVPVDEVPVEETPAVETPVEETPAVETPVVALGGEEETPVVTLIPTRTYSGVDDGAGNPYAVVGKSTPILARVTEKDTDKVISVGSVTFVVDGNTVGTAVIKNTGSGPIAAYNYKFTTAGPHSVLTIYNGVTDIYEASNYTSTVYAFSPTVMAESANATWGKLGTTFTFTATLKDSQKHPIANEPVTVYYTTSTSAKAAQTDIAYTTTDANGKFTAVLKPAKNGTYYVTAAFYGDTANYYYASSATVTITVSNVPPTGDNFNAPLWIAVILLSVGTGSYILLRKKRDF